MIYSTYIILLIFPKSVVRDVLKAFEKLYNSGKICGMNDKLQRRLKA